MISKKQKIIAVSLAIIAALGISVAAAYDSSEDPIVSLSYLISVFKPELMDDINSRIDEEVARRIENLDLSQFQNNQQDNSSSSTAYEVIELKMGDSVYATSACDIMLRAGSAYCIAPDAGQGIADYTSGAEIYNYDYLTKNHMCLIPRGDGRGIRADSESVFIMIRGEYTIVKG